MSALPSSQLQSLVHEALAARVRVLLDQSTFDELMATQARVSLALAMGAVAFEGQGGSDNLQSLAEALVNAFAMDPTYYAGSDLDFLVSESLSAVGLALADVVRGHEQDSRARWQAEVVPQLDRIEGFVVSVFDGSWSRSARRLSLDECLRGKA